MKCKRAETAKKFGPEHCITLKTGLKWPKMTKNDQNALKFNNLVNFHKKSLLLIQFTPVWSIELGLAKKQSMAAIRG